MKGWARETILSEISSETNRVITLIITLNILKQKTVRLKWIFFDLFLVKKIAMSTTTTTQIVSLITTLILAGAIVYVIQRLRTSDKEIRKLQQLIAVNLDARDVQQICNKHIKQYAQETAGTASRFYSGKQQQQHQQEQQEEEEDGEPETPSSPTGNKNNNDEEPATTLV